MTSKPLSPSGSPGVFRPMMLNPVVSSAGHREHVIPLPLRVLALPHGWCGEFTVHVVPITLPVPSGSGFYSRCKAWDSGVGLYGLLWLCAHTQGGTLSNLRAVRYGVPCQSQTGVITANVEQEAPCRFSGYSAITPVVGDPHTPGL